MKIGIFGDSFLPIYDGVGRVMKAYAENLSHLGHEVYVISPKYMDTSNLSLGYEIISFNSHKLIKGLPYRIGSPNLDTKFKKKIKDIEFDIIHIHSPFCTGPLGLKIAKKRKIPCVGTFHTKFYDDVLSITHSRLLAKITARFTGNSYSKCTEVWAVSKGSAETLKNYGCKKEILVMPNGCEHRDLPDKELQDKVREKYNIKSGIFTALFVGRLNWNKGIRKCIDAVKILKDREKQIQFIIAGQGPHENEIKALIHKYNLDDNIHLIGFVSDREELDCLYSICDLFLLPSIYDNSPLVTKEAAMMKRCSLVIKNSSASEEIIDNENGLVSIDDDLSISNKIQEFMMLDKEKREKMEENAFRTIPVSWSKICKDVEQRYIKLVSEFDQ